MIEEGNKRKWQQIMNDGINLMKAGRLPEAESEFLLAVKLLENAGLENLLFHTLHPLGSVYQLQQKYDHAEPIFRKLLALAEEQGPEDPNVMLPAISCMATICVLQQHYDEADLLLKRLLVFAEKSGKQCPDVYITGIAGAYRQQGKFEEAEALYNRVLERTEEGGPDAERAIAHLNNLAKLQIKQGNTGEAEALYKRALAIAEQSTGDGQNVAACLSRLAGLFADGDRHKEAEILYQRELKIRDGQGQDDADLALCLGRLAHLYNIKQNKPDDAEPLYKRSIPILERIALTQFDPGDIKSGSIASLQKQSAVAWCSTDLQGLARVYMMQGKPQDAESCHKRVVAMVEKAQGPNHADLARALERYAKLLHKMHREEDARPIEARAQAIKLTPPK
jgi:tetratricopeptide (TPR) repeat protein